MEQVVHIGGLMRCCTQTIADYEGEPEPGAVVPCKWCTSSMVVAVEASRLRLGEPVLAWRWNHPKEATDER